MRLLRLIQKLQFFCQMSVQNMSKSNSGSIINICSLASKIGFPNNTSYIASKGALYQSTKSLALDLAKKILELTIYCQVI